MWYSKHRNRILRNKNSVLSILFKEGYFMIKLFRKRWVAFVAVLLSIVVGGYFILSNTRTENTAAEIRTNKVLPEPFRFG